MGASVSLPRPFEAFSRLSLADVDAMIVRHRKNLDGAFMVSPEELRVLLGPKLGNESGGVLAALEAGEAGKVNALTLLTGAVAMCRVKPAGPRGERSDGVKDKEEFISVPLALSDMLNEIVLPRAKRENSFFFRTTEMREASVRHALSQCRPKLKAWYTELQNSNLSVDQDDKVRRSGPYARPHGSQGLNPRPEPKA